jgi:hypothetical protein
MEQLLLDRRDMTGGMFALEGAATNGLEFIGFDPVPLAEAEPARDEDIHAMVAIPPKPARRRRGVAPMRPHLVRIWLDDGELLKLTEGADAAGIALPDYLRARALNDPKARARPAAREPDLFLPVALPPSAPAPPEAPAPVIVQLSPDLEERIDAYYAPADRFDANAIFYGRATGDPKPGRLGRLGQFLIELFGARPLSHRALSREGA